MHAVNEGSRRLLPDRLHFGTVHIPAGVYLFSTVKFRYRFNRKEVCQSGTCPHPDYGGNLGHPCSFVEFQHLQGGFPVVIYVDIIAAVLDAGLQDLHTILVIRTRRIHDNIHINHAPFQ